MTIQDQVVLALTCWRENRGGAPQPQAMQSVANVVLNRAAARGTDAYTECVRPEQFSSLTAKGDPELTLFPTDADPQWQLALKLAELAAQGQLPDVTGGATDYYAPAGIVSTATFALPDGTTVKFPQHWVASRYAYTCTVAGQLFFKS